MPVALADLSLAGFRPEVWTGLWSWTSYTLEHGMSILLALVGSFIVTGPLLLPMSRRGRYYAREGQPLMAWQTAGKIGLLSLPILCFALLLVTVVGFVFRELAPPSPVHFVGFFTALSFLWLSTVITFIVGQPMLILLSYVGGNFVASAVYHKFVLPLFPVQILGILSVTLALLFLSYLSVWLKQRRSKVRKAFNTPRLSSLFISDFPYMLFGGLYALLLFGDRLIAWTAFRLNGATFPFNAYEIGMTMAILTLFVIGAVMEVLGLHFRRATLPKALVSRTNRPLMRFYWTATLSFLAAVILGRLVLSSNYIFTSLSRVFAVPPDLIGTVGNIMLIGVVAYALIFWGLFQSFLLLEFGVFTPTVAILALSLFVEIAVGLASALLWGPLYALVGMLAGGALFAAATSARLLYQFRHRYRELFPAAI